jgi:hypothetical protein
MNPASKIRTATTLPCALLAVALSACGGDDSGSLSVLIEAEDTIQEGIEADDGSEADESIRDGWSASFDKYVLAVGDVDLELSTERGRTAEAKAVFAVDLTKIPPAGLSLWTLQNLDAGRWEFHYSLGGAADGAERHESVTQADFDAMQSSDLTYLIHGSLTKTDGRSCPPASFADPPAGATSLGTNAGGDECYANPVVSFAFGVSSETLLGPCELDGVSGVSVPAGGTQTVAITIHGDHLFFNGFPTGDEGGTVRLAQWLADCDLNLDGEVTREELEQLRPSDLPEMDGRYQFGASPIEALETQSLWIYVTAQLKTQGHLQGEGECEIDGATHVD